MLIGGQPSMPCCTSVKSQPRQALQKLRSGLSRSTLPTALALEMSSSFSPRVPRACGWEDMGGDRPVQPGTHLPSLFAFSGAPPTLFFAPSCLQGDHNLLSPHFPAPPASRLIKGQRASSNSIHATHKEAPSPNHTSLHDPPSGKSSGEKKASS